jgi:putative hydrolase of the HAD superfamily
VIDIVFFDAGETILHPHPSFPELFSTVCRDAGTSVSAADVARVQDRIAPHLLELVEEAGIESGPSLSEADAKTFWIYLYKRFLSELGIADESLADKLFERFSSISSYKLFDDVVATLDALRRDGYRLGLISNFERWLEELLVELEVGHLFDVVVISGAAGVEKPDPEIYRIALRKADVAPSAAVHVGDSPRLDAEPAEVVGLFPVLLDRLDRYPDARWPRISSLKELPDVVSNL